MIIFERYPHVNELISHYSSTLDRNDISILLKEDISTAEDAEKFSHFIWQMVEAINEDEENEVAVLGSQDNTDMLPDISYEVTKLMKSKGFYSVWERVSNEEIG